MIVSIVVCLSLMFLEAFVDNPKIVSAINDLSPFCNDTTYICCHNNGCQIPTRKTGFLQDLPFENYEKSGKNPAFRKGLLHKDDCFYYLISDRLRYLICKTTTYETNIVVDSFTVDPNYLVDYQFSISGFDNYAYFVLKEKIYRFDFCTETMVSLDDSSNWASYLLNHDSKLCQEEYCKTLGIEKGKCERKNDIVYFTYFNRTFQLNEKGINDEAFSTAVFKHKFTPDYHISYSSGLTSLFYLKKDFNN